MVALNFKNGIIPVAAQDNETGEVLMIAFMNEDAFNLTRKTGCVHYWSRKNRRVWKKGEVSGHFQRVKQILVDCDNDSLVIKVDQVLSLIHISEPTRLLSISYAVFCLKKKKTKLKNMQKIHKITKKKKDKKTKKSIQ